MRRIVLLGVIAACGAPKAAPRVPAASAENTYQPPKPVAGPRHWDWFPEDRAYMNDLLKDLRQTGERESFPRLVELVDRTQRLVENADREGLSKEQVLGAYVSFEKAMTDPIGESLGYRLDDLREIMRRRALLP